MNDPVMTAIAHDRCPDCGTSPFERHQGPRGGMSINVMCKHCFSAFNIALFMGVLVNAHRIANHFWQDQPGYIPKDEHGRADGRLQ